jgi:hypothetical protein
MYEPSAVPPLSTWRFVLRLARHAGYGGVLVAFSLAVGTAGFVSLAAQRPIDAFLNAAMLLGGMGPVGDLSRASPAGKIFAAGFALYAGLAFLLLAGLLLTPMFHRVLHRFHWERDRAER